MRHPKSVRTQIRDGDHIKRNLEEACAQVNHTFLSEIEFLEAALLMMIL